MIASTPCRGCGALIVFIKMKETGRTMPCEAALQSGWLEEAAGTAATTVTRITPDGLTIIGRPVPPDTTGARDVSGYIPHWGTCPNRADFKTPKGA